jgi:hypothetical protein
MAHYAFIDKNNIVTQVISGRNRDNLVEGVSSWEDYYAGVRGEKCLETSSDTYGGKHLTGGTPLRGNYASVGYIYDEVLDAFIPPKPFESWLLDKSTFNWVAPIEYPADGAEYEWDESEGDWVEVI